MKPKYNLSVVVLAFCLTLSSCGTLDPSGVYQGNKALYGMDVTISTPIKAINGFLGWEKQNRLLLWKIDPNIKKVADQLRINVPVWAQNVTHLRDVYAANPTDANRTAFDTALALLNEAAIQVLQIMTKNAISTINPK